MTSKTEEQLLLRNIMGGMWKTNPVSTEPAINLVKWNVFAVPAKNGLDVTATLTDIILQDMKEEFPQKLWRLIKKLWLALHVLDDSID